MIIVKRKRVFFIPCTDFEISGKTSSEKFINDLVRSDLDRYQLLLDREPPLNISESIEQIVLKVNSILKDIKTVIITDDSQNIYDVEKLWTTILKINYKTVISFASYRLSSSIDELSTPADFVKRETYPIGFLLFTKNEFSELVEKLRMKSSREARLLSKRVCEEIFQITKGYPFLVFETLNDFIPKKTRENFSEEQLFTEFFKNNFRNFLSELSRIGEGRCFKTIKKLEEEVRKCFIKHQTNKQIVSPPAVEKILKDWLDMLIFYHSKPNRVPILCFNADELRDWYDLCLKALVRSCVVIRDNANNQCYFFNEIFHYYYNQVYLQCWYPSKMGKKLKEHDKQLIMSSSIREKADFVKRLVEQFDPILMKNCQTRSRDNSESESLLEPPYDHWVNTALKFLGFTSISSQYNQNMEGNF